MIYGEVGRLADEAFGLSIRQAENAALLAVAVQYAWLELCFESYRSTSAAVRAELGQQARTRRLIQRGVLPSIAAQELHIV
ncbi:hypothetical protein [Methylobacterium sp. J-077]|uniref:hypothetical protein n=1 Tax=Methylobacterium sp. J-077 TaxID=2836656 RepID=UPI001FB9A2D2|nr:hypothetical protein [Methylobacterium sp. J-077]MCJ2121854.1 hypothetical protein [Methylobacterium sp. J-077]